MKNTKKPLIIFLSSVIVLTIFSYYISELTGDEIWNYGFSYNIASGLIPYKDFNMVVGPLYNFLLAFFLIPFKNNLFVFHLANNILISLFLVMISRKINYRYIVILLFFMFIPTMHSYNTFVALLVIGIIMLEDSSYKHNNILIGILVGSIFITKQNVGLLLIIAYIINSKNKIKPVCSLLIPPIILGIFLIMTRSFYQYIDFCFLGLGGFLDNLLIEIPAIILEIIVCFYLIYKYFKTKDKKISYLLAFQVIAFPVVDFYHVLVGMIPVLYYFLLYDNNRNLTLLIKTILSISLLFQTIIAVNGYHIMHSNFSKYRYASKNIDIYMDNFSSYVLEKEKNYDVYLFIDNAYLIRLTLNQNPHFYDLINSGNLGSDLNRYTNDMIENCKDKHCLFVLDKMYFYDEMASQLHPLFKDVVVDNYTYFETLPSGDVVYKN